MILDVPPALSVIDVASHYLRVHQVTSTCCHENKTQVLQEQQQR